MPRKRTYKKEYSWTDAARTHAMLSTILAPLPSDGSFKERSKDDAMTDVYCILMGEIRTPMSLPYFVPFSKHDDFDLRADAMMSMFSMTGTRNANNGSVSYFNKMVSAVRDIIKFLKDYIREVFYTDEEEDAEIQYNIKDMQKHLNVNYILRYTPNTDAKSYFMKFLGQILRGVEEICLEDAPWLLGRALSIALRSYYKDVLTVLINRKKSEAKHAYDVYHDMMDKIAPPKKKWVEPIVMTIHKGFLRLTTRIKKSNKLDGAKRIARKYERRKFGRFKGLRGFDLKEPPKLGNEIPC